MTEEPDYKLRLRDFSWFYPGLTGYMIRNEFSDENSCDKCLYRALAIITLNSALTIGALYGAWKGLETLIN